MDEARLAEGCKVGKAKCQRLLYERYARKFFGVCLRYADDRAEAEDMLQESFVKIFDGINGYRGEGSFEGWMRAIVTRTALDFCRKRKRRPQTDDLADAPEELLPETNGFCEDREILLAAIRSLPDGYRTVFNLFVIEGYSHKEIAEKLGVSEGASKSQLSHARAALKKKLSQTYETELAV